MNSELNLKALVEAARAGGAVLKKYFGTQLTIKQKKTVGDFQTAADVESEQAILQVLTKAFPQVNIHAEESGQTEKGSDYTLCIDPLDGSNNFVIGIPYFSVSIALMQGNETVASVVYDPMTERLFSATKGQGATLNGHPLQVNAISDVKQSTISHVCGYLTSADYHAALYNQLDKHLDCKRVLTNWALALDFCLLASGQIEGIVVYDVDTHDCAAGRLIAREAGALITDLDGHGDHDRNTKFVVSNGTSVHQLLVKTAQTVFMKKDV